MPRPVLQRKRSSGSTDKKPPAPVVVKPPEPPPAVVTPAPATPPKPDTRDALTALGDRFKDQQAAKEEKELRASGRHKTDCQCERCKRNREKKAALTTPSEIDQRAQEYFEKKIREINTGTMQFLAKISGTDPPNDFERMMTEDGAVELANRMSPEMRAKMALITFMTGWGIFIGGRLLQYFKAKKEKAEEEERKPTMPGMIHQLP